MTYYTDGLKVSRIDGGVFESYCFPLGRWVQDLSLCDMLIGELDMDEISEEEAYAAITKRNSEIHSD